MTNGDRIRKMTDEELAKKLRCNSCLYQIMRSECESSDCEYGIIAWLQKKVNEDVGTDLQTAEAKMVRHGQWIPLKGWLNKSNVKCSVCGNTLDMDGVNAGRGDANFCPNCGARMDTIDYKC